MNPLILFTAALPTAGFLLGILGIFKLSQVLKRRGHRTLGLVPLFILVGLIVGILVLASLSR